MTDHRLGITPRFRPLQLLCAASLLWASSAFAQGDGTVLEVAAETPEFSTLINVLDAAGLTQTLQGGGPFTVFAPTNEAFAELPAGELDALLADRSALARLLSYHVVPGSFTTADITAEMTGFTTLTGDELPITQEGVGDAAVTAVNIPASNGVVFAIDTVLTPPAVTGEIETETGETGGLYSSTALENERFDLVEANGSGVSGSALIAAYAGGRSVVTVSLNGAETGQAYEARLYRGGCADEATEVAAELEPVSGSLGFSTTTLTVPYGTIVGISHRVLVLSGDETVACGEVGV